MHRHVLGPQPLRRDRALDRGGFGPRGVLGDAVEAGPFRAFATVALPSAREGLASGLALAWGRALGEFGATLLFAGSLPGVTRTAPLAIFSEFSEPGGFVAALALSAVLIAVAAALLLSVKLLGGAEQLEAGRPR